MPARASAAKGGGGRGSCGGCLPPTHHHHHPPPAAGLPRRPNGAWVLFTAPSWSMELKVSLSREGFCLGDHRTPPPPPSPSSWPQVCPTEGAALLLHPTESVCGGVAHPPFHTGVLGLYRWESGSGPPHTPQNLRRGAGCKPLRPSVGGRGEGRGRDSDPVSREGAGCGGTVLSTQGVLARRCPKEQDKAKKN